MSLEVLLERLEMAVKDDEDGPPSSPYAVQRVRDLLTAAAALLPDEMPRGSVSTPDAGDCAVYWRNATRSIRLAVPKAQEHSWEEYLYHCEGADYAADSPVTAEGLAHWLHWFREGIA